MDGLGCLRISSPGWMSREAEDMLLRKLLNRIGKSRSFVHPMKYDQGRLEACTTMRMADGTVLFAITQVLFVLMTAILVSPLWAESRYVRNGSFNTKGGVKPYFTQETVDNLRKNGWTCPDADGWPAWWSGLANDMTLEWFPTGGKNDDAYIRISGKNGLVTGYHGLPLEPCNIEVLWLRGKGVLRAAFLGYKQVDGQVQGGAPTPSLEIKVNSSEWVQYRVPLRKSPELWNIHVAFSVPEGSIDIDEVDVIPANEAQMLVSEEAATMYGTGSLVENMSWAAVDDQYKKRVVQYQNSVNAFQKLSNMVDAGLVKDFETLIADLNVYVLAPDAKSVLVEHYNDMLILTHLLKRLSGLETAAGPVTATSFSNSINYKPGERSARPGTVTILDIRSNKVRYYENENATTSITLINTTAVEQKGTLIATLITELDTRREVDRKPYTLQANQNVSLTLNYSVGPETYGRALEVRLIDDSGKLVDTWQEFYAVAAEWFRVQQHTPAAAMKNYKTDPWVTYFNQIHNFACEPTDWGVQVEEFKSIGEYLSAQALYPLNLQARRAVYAYYKSVGIMGTFYQNVAYSGQMGYEVIREHPEFALYDQNGQPAVDPVYGGYPNPMELASPIETGSTRKVIKPYLNRKLSAWHHSLTNLAREDAVRYGAERIKEYADYMNCSGIYWDGNLGLYSGYGYDGKPAVPSGKYEDYVALNARNHRLYSSILKKDNPNFGTWYNWARVSIEYYTSQGLKAYLGSGVGKADRLDDSVRAAAGWKNVMFLMEVQSALTSGDDDMRYPSRMLSKLCDNRDFLVQRYGANIILGYLSNSTVSADAPGPDRWGWAMHNYFGAQLIATQNHFASWFVPSWRPTLQFLTRYSRFIWAPDIKVIPAGIVNVSSHENVWWKRLAYKRKRSDGYDLIIHLVRIPPTKMWDLTYTVEPKPLSGVVLNVKLGKGELQDVHAIRPYYYEEPQQPVQARAVSNVMNGQAKITVPPFRYHMMFVLRVKSVGSQKPAIRSH